MDSQIRHIHQQLVTKQITCTKLIQEKIDLLKANTYNTVNSLLDKTALELAVKVDEKIKNGEKIGLLEGIPFGVKDVYMLQGTNTTASSNLLKNYKSPYTATAIQKLLDAGAIPIVKENCDSFGHGSSSENTIFGAVKNALNPALVAGGSSGGSAVNVAKDYTVFSIGGDTGGSIRQPAGYNHIYGLKPTYGRISRYGLMAYASSTDCVGPLAKSVEDIRIILNIMSGKDPKDQTSIVSKEIVEKAISINTVKTIGYFKNFIESDAIDTEVKADFLASIKKIKATGIEVKALDFFKSNILVSTYYTLAMAETASNLSRLDGTNYGNRIEAENLIESYAVTRSENFSEETKRRIVGGNQVLSQGFSDEIYLKGLALRDQISENFNKDFKDVDVILSPVTPSAPPKIGESLKDPHAMYLSDAYTVGFSLAQLPTLTVPQGTVTGLQITAAKNNEELILKFANFLKRNDIMELEQLNAAIKKHDLELVIGLETHVRLNTKTKLFCSCPNQEIETPNTNICSVCTGQMGVLPAINKEAITKAIYFGKAVDSSFDNEVISWDRKHYEYPDNPKNIQITQFHNPIIPDGHVSCYRNDGSQFTVNLTQVHIEEDAAKLMHEKNISLVDFNKAGVPLIEIVTEPCIRNIEDASTYAQYIQRIVQNLGISEANLEKGEFKSDVSVSLRKKRSYDLNPRTEIKNLNSFKFMVDALKEEIEKQFNYYIEHKEFRPDQTTVLWDADLKQTKTMRKKEFEADYRFISEPDLPFVSIKNEIKAISVDSSALPFAVETVLIKGGVLPQDAKFFTADAVRSKVFMDINRELKDPSFVAKTLVNNIKSDDYASINSIESLIEIFQLFKAEKITAVLAQNGITAYLKDRTFDYNKYFEDNTISEDKIEEAIQKVILENQAIANDIKSGNQGKAGILVGKVISIIGKGASGKVIREGILEILSAKSKQPTANRQQPIANNEQQKSKVEDETLPEIPIIIKDIYRTHKASEISEKNISEKVTLAGWVSSVRDHGELIFIDLRDSSNEIFQVRLSRESFPNLDELVKLKPESVISVTGVIVQRNEDDYNASLRTGKIELETSELDILNLSKTLPFEIKRAPKTSETIRFQYKFLDHRNDAVRRAIVNRHKVIKLLRDILDEEEFLEIETPILTAGTDEGAREFIVPTRKQSGYFYTLPQAPQQFKQMLMVSGYEKYFQIARCFRDEDSRGDRQPEFTQLDIEMAYASMQQIIDLNTKMFNEIVQKIYGKKWILHPFEVLTYKEAMDNYGCDRPDLRYGLQMQDITHIVKDTTFQVFSKPIEQGGIVKCIKVSAKEQGNSRMSKGQIENLTAIAQQNGLGGLAYIIVNENDLQSPIIKFLGAEIAAGIINETNAEVGDIVFFSAADYETANKALDAVRQEMGKILGLINPKELRPAWVIDFPMFEKTDEGRWTFTHNPFSMPAIYDLDKHMNSKEEEIGSIIAQQYDLILNGYEIGGGSVRAHKAEILEATYRNMGYSKNEMIKSVGAMYKAFQYGAPPHGGIAWGIDRLMMILEKKASIREVMAFPKTGTSDDLLFGAPSMLSDKKVEEQNVKVIR